MEQVRRRNFSEMYAPTPASVSPKPPSGQRVISQGHTSHVLRAYSTPARLAAAASALRRRHRRPSRRRSFTCVELAFMTLTGVTTRSFQTSGHLQWHHVSRAIFGRREKNREILEKSPFDVLKNLREIRKRNLRTLRKKCRPGPICSSRILMCRRAPQLSLDARTGAFDREDGLDHGQVPQGPQAVERCGDERGVVVRRQRKFHAGFLDLQDCEQRGSRSPSIEIHVPS